MKVTAFSRRDAKGMVTRPVGATKGDAGSVLVILGSAAYTGAGILAALAALRSGADIVGILAPEEACSAINARAPDVIAHRIAAKRLAPTHLQTIKRVMERYNVVLIGPGADLGEGMEHDLIKAAKDERKAIVLDADLTHTLTLENLDDTVLCANASEYADLITKNGLAAMVEDVHAAGSKASKKSKEQLEAERLALEQEKVACAVGTNIVLRKGPNDLVFAKDGILNIQGGSLRGTVAGTGDVLAGLIAGFRAQGLGPKDATLVGATVAKRAAEILEERLHYSFFASDYLTVIPEVLKELKLFRVVKHTWLHNH